MINLTAHEIQAKAKKVFFIDKVFTYKDVEELKAEAQKSGIKIGNNVNIDNFVTLYNNVTIGDNVRIGQGAVVLPGVLVGNGAVVAPNEVVQDDIYGKEDPAVPAPIPTETEPEEKAEVPEIEFEDPAVKVDAFIKKVIGE